MSRNLVDDVKLYQRTWEKFVNEYIIKELLLESTFENPLDEGNIVYLRFNEIDVDAKIKVQNHATQLFTTNGITHSEYRRSIGREPFSDEDWEDSFWTLIEEPRALISAVDEPYLASAAVVNSEETSISPDDQSAAEAARKKEADLEAKTQAKIARAKPRPATAKSRASRGARSSAAANRPSNQHGTKTGPEKRKSSFDSEYELLDMVSPNNVVTDLYDTLLRDAVEYVRRGTFDINWFKQLTNTVANLMKEKLERVMRIDFREGFRSVSQNLTADEMNVAFAFIEVRTQRITNRFTGRLFSEITRVFDKNDTPDIQAVKISSVFDVLRFRSRFIYNSECNKASNYGKLRAFRKLGVKEVQVVVGENACEDCLKSVGKISTLELDIDTIPGFHPNCTCTLKALE
jgi:hypothetical protein